MKPKWLTLAKVQLAGAFGLNKLRYSDDARAKKRAGLAAAALVLALAVILFYDVMISLAFVGQGITSALPGFMIAAASLVTFVFSLVRGCSMLFAAKDYDAVMSLPVTKAAVIASRLAVTYIVNLAFALLVCVPSAAVYFAAAGFSFREFSVILSALLFCPLAPIAAAAAVGTAVTALTARFRYKSLLQSLIGIVLIVGVVVASFAFSFSTDSESADMNALAALLAGRIYPPAALVSAAMRGRTWAAFVFAGINAGAAALLIAAAAPFYAKINARLNAGGAGAAFKEKQIRSSGVFGALFKKECKRLFSSSAYLMNTVIGSVFLLIAAAAMLIFDPISRLSGLTEEGIPAQMLGYIFGTAGLIFAGMTFPSVCSLSFEGRSRWIMCSLPLPAKTVLMAKTAVGFVFSMPAAFIFSVIVCAQSGADAPMWAALITAPLAYCAFISMFGTFLNYKFPKYDWANETAAVKNNIPVLILTFGEMAAVIAVLVAVVFAGRLGYIPLFVFAAACTAGSIALRRGFMEKARLYDGSPSAAAPLPQDTLLRR